MAASSPPPRRHRGRQRLELTDNFDKEVLQSGKAAFIKFLALVRPCKKMKPDWDARRPLRIPRPSSSLTSTAPRPASRSATSTASAATRPSNPPDEDGKDWGGRDLARSRSSSRRSSARLSADTKENCSAEQLKDLEKYISMDPAEREKKMTDLKDALKKAEDDHNELLKQLQAQFKESQDGLEKLKEESAPVIKLLKAATPSAAAGGAGKDEVYVHRSDRMGWAWG